MKEDVSPSSTSIPIASLSMSDIYLLKSNYHVPSLTSFRLIISEVPVYDQVGGVLVSTVNKLTTGRGLTSIYQVFSEWTSLSSVRITEIFHLPTALGSLGLRSNFLRMGSNLIQLGKGEPFSSTAV